MLVRFVIYKTVWILGQIVFAPFLTCVALWTVAMDHMLAKGWDEGLQKTAGNLLTILDQLRQKLETKPGMWLCACGHHIDVHEGKCFIANCYCMHFITAIDLEHEIVGKGSTRGGLGVPNNLDCGCPAGSHDA